MGDNSLGFNIEYEEKKKLFKVLSEQLSKFIEEKNFLLNVKKPNIEAKYMTLIGKYEMKRMNIDFEVRELKREISLRQAALNRGENITEEYIRETLEKELKEWKENVNAFLQQIKNAELRHYS